MTSSTSSTTTSINTNVTTGGDLTSGTSSSSSTGNSTGTTSTTGAGTTSTSIPFITLSNVTVYIGVNGNYSSIIPNRFAAAVALSLNVDQSQVTSVTIELADARDADSRTRSLRTRSSFPAGVGGNVVCTAVISYSTLPPEVAVVQNAFNSTSSVVATYFAKLNATIVTVNITITSTERPILTTTTTTSLGGSKPNVNTIAVPVGLAVPGVVIIGAAGGFAFVKYRRNRRAAHRARHWDMHNMYSGLSISMVEYA